MNGLLCRMVGGGRRNNPGPSDYHLRSKIGDAPKWTIKNRYRSVERPITAPYRNLPTTVGDAPKIALSSRHRENSPPMTPGPNYVPPKLGTSARKNTMSFRNPSPRDPRADNPGPGSYSISPRFANDASKFTLHQRTGTESRDISPGPAAYTPDFKKVRKSSPVPTLHIRPESKAPIVTPGPSDYRINRDLGGQASSMHIRSRDIKPNINPGPGQYSPTAANKPKDPSYTIKGRYKSAEKPNTAPYRDLGTTVGEGPKISLSSRHKEQEGMATPGPNYVPPKLGEDAPKNSMSFRYSEEQDPRAANPGPGSYNIQPKFANEANKYTLHQRTGTEAPDISPGPAAYTPDFTKVKKNAPLPSLHIRPEDKPAAVTPGPSDYEISRDLGGQSSTMHVRSPDLPTSNNPGPGQYTPTDSNLQNNPRFTIKGRYKSAEKPNTAPYRDLGTTVGEGPKISLSSRHKEQEGMATPGPNYVPPKLGEDAPKNSMSFRYSEEQDPRAANPGPGSYNIQPKFANEANKYTLHQRTGTEAPDISPGPAAYTPDFTKVKKKAPASTMHIRPEDKPAAVTPGPSDYEISRDLGGQSSTMHVRSPDLPTSNNPGPGQYTPTDSNLQNNPRFTIKGRYENNEKPNTAPYRDLGTTVGEGPKISLSSRHKEQEGMATPGPNYVPPKLGEDAPKNSMSFRYSEEQDPRAANPGPGSYNIQPKFANEANKYTLHQRTGTEAPDISPGPAAYTPDFTKVKKNAPASTMHIRPEDKPAAVTPGPSDYEISRDLGGQSSTMHVRSPDLPTSNNPGPGQYTPTDSNLQNNPRFTIKGRYENNEKPNTAPYRDLGTTVGEGPKISLSSRHKEQEGMATPGPNYVPPKLGEDAPKNSMSFRYSEEQDPRAANPGPGSYNIQPKFANEANKYTLHQRTGTEAPDISPGPAAYTPDFTKVKKNAPASTMHIRPEDKPAAVTPGPSDYEISRDLGGQSSTMHVRSPDLPTSNNPGPGQYTPTDSNLQNNPRFTIKGRYENNEKPNTAPYRDLGTTVGEGPKISLSSRHKEQEGMATPGPNYVPPKLGEDAPKNSMSFRYSEEQDPRAANPGPGSYNIQPKFANEANKYTLHQRTGTEAPDISPGPAAYTPDFTKVKKNAPASTMHIRPEDKPAAVTPGPSDYEISRDLGGQSSTMHVRSPDLPTSNNPGPGQYTPTDSNLQNNPRFTIKGRYENNEKPNTAPYRDLGTTVGEGPKISLSSRHKEQEGMATPGPNYVPPKLGEDAPKNSMSFRYSEEQDPRAANPGPGSYNIQPKFANEANKYTLHQRTGTEAPDISPGPAAYTPDFNATKANAPASSIHIRPQDKDPEQTPGYVKLPSTLGGPKYTIGEREDLDYEIM